MLGVLTWASWKRIPNVADQEATSLAGQLSVRDRWSHVSFKEGRLEEGVSEKDSTPLSFLGTSILVDTSKYHLQGRGCLAPSCSPMCLMREVRGRAEMDTA